MFPDKSLTINQGTAKCCAYFVGGKMTHKEKEERNTEIVQLRHEGQSMAQIAERYGISASTVRVVCKKYGVAGVMSDRKPSVYRNGKCASEDTARKYISRYDNFEYVGNYTGIDGYADIRCKTCGTVQKKSMVTIRKHRNLICQKCVENARQQRIVDRAKAKQEEAEKKKLDRFWSQGFAQIAFKTCPVCGTAFVGSKTYCSERCRDNNKQKLKDGYRHLFPLQDVYERDGGICYLCGKPCDWDDYSTKNGVIVYGNNYPSRDHMIPKSRGGLNTWENIRLAHRICNSLKADSPLV